jgi:hypothetical protein
VDEGCGLCRHPRDVVGIMCPAAPQIGHWVDHPSFGEKLMCLGPRCEPATHLLLADRELRRDSDGFLQICVSYGMPNNTCFEERFLVEDSELVPSTALLLAL